jgi:hypothetical protein
MKDAVLSNRPVECNSLNRIGSKASKKVEKIGNKKEEKK